MAEKFAAGNVTISRRYQVDCSVCNEDITDGEPVRTREHAEEIRKSHIGIHRAGADGYNEYPPYGR